MEKDRIMDDHDTEVERLKLKLRQTECDFRSKLDDLHYQSTDLRCSKDQFNMQLHQNTMNYEEVIQNLRNSEIALKSEIQELKSIIKKLNSKNHNLETQNLTIQKELSNTRESK